MFLELMGYFLLGMAVGCVACSIVVSVLNSWNIREVSSTALKNSDSDKAKQLVGKILTGIVRDKKETGGMVVTTLDMMDENEKVAEVTINSECVSSDIAISQRYDGIMI